MHLPRDDTGEGGVRARDAEERPEVLDADGGVRDVDREPDAAHDEPREDERGADFDLVGPYGKHQQHDCWRKEGLARRGWSAKGGTYSRRRRAERSEAG